jgi:nucleoside-diphosphate-sugar epimerase
MILVTGATGILGRVIVLDLLKQGRSVRATKRKTSNIAEVKHSFQFYTENPEEYFDRIEWIDVDFDDISSLEKALVNIDEIYHCAAKVSFHPDDRQQMYHSNIVGTRNLLYATENFKIKKFCFVSSIAVLDGFNETGQLTEDSNFNSKIHHSKYAKSKHFSEMEVWRASAEGLNVVIINPGVIIGSGNWKSSSGEIFGTFEKFPFAMSGNSNYVDVRDVAKIAINLMDQDFFSDRFIIISENKKLVEVANLIRKKLGKSNAKVIPNFILNGGYLLNILLGWLFRPLKLMNRVNIEAVTSNNVVSNQKIKEKLNYQFIPISESIDFHLKNYISDQKKSPQ